MTCVQMVVNYHSPLISCNMVDSKECLKCSKDLRSKAFVLRGDFSKEIDQNL